MDHTPIAIRTAVIRRTTSLFRAENSMIQLIMFVLRRRGRLRLLCRRRAVLMRNACRTQSTLRIDEERSGRNDPFSRLQSFEDLYPIADPPPDLDIARLQVTTTKVDEHCLPFTRIEERFRWNRDRRRGFELKLDVDCHIGLQEEARISSFETNLQSASHGINVRLHEGDTR